LVGWWLVGWLVGWFLVLVGFGWLVGFGFGWLVVISRLALSWVLLLLHWLDSELLYNLRSLVRMEDQEEKEEGHSYYPIKEDQYCLVRMENR
jgi:hypothetical protein